MSCAASKARTGFIEPISQTFLRRRFRVLFAFFLNQFPTDQKQMI
jgi:hypothetical protein